MTEPVAESAQQAFRRRLQQGLADRCAKNPRYSVRAFARWLGVDHSTLSQLIRGARPVSAAAIARLGDRLGSDQPAPVSGRDLPAAILALIGRPGFRSDSRWIARTLGVTADDVNRILPELLRTHQLVMAARRRWLVRTLPS